MPPQERKREMTARDKQFERADYIHHGGPNNLWCNRGQLKLDGVNKKTMTYGLGADLQEKFSKAQT